jgi:hypothetical protein
VIEHYEFDEEIRQAVSTAVRPYGNDIEYEDALQEGYVYWYSDYNQERLAAGNDPKHEINWLLRFSVVRYCRQQRSTQRGFDPQDEVRYNTAVIKKLIPLALFGHYPTPVLDGERISGKPDPAVGGDVLAMVMDIRSALHTLDRDELQLVALAACLDGEWTYHADVPDRAAAKRAFARVVRKIQEGLGGDPDDYEGPGSRTAVSAARVKAGMV